MIARNMENTGEGRGGRWRIAAWATAALLLLLPLVAMQFSDEVNWTVADFVFAAVLLFGSLGVYELMVRMTGNTAYRAAAGVALATTFLLIWINGAVGITDGNADLMFFLLVPTVGIIGALIARFQPRGMARAMFVMALAQALVAGSRCSPGWSPRTTPPLRSWGLPGSSSRCSSDQPCCFEKRSRGNPSRARYDPPLQADRTRQRLGLARAFASVLAAADAIWNGSPETLLRRSVSGDVSEG